MGRKRKEEPPLRFDDLEDTFGPLILAKFLKRSKSTIYGLLKNYNPVIRKPVNPDMEFIPCHKIGSTYVIVKREFGLHFGIISDVKLFETEVETDEKAV